MRHPVPPLITTTIDETRRAVIQARKRGLTIGLVPTMGALHAGHVSLIRAARAETGFVAVSIFVNPTQFGPNEDFHRYPRPFEQDVKTCAAEGVDLIFHPEPEMLYPAGYHTFVEVHELQDVLCGASRPRHFRGVATIVCKLFTIVQPDIAYFGQKDAQQARIIQQMVRDLNLPLTIGVQPIVREADGLALSSRNQYLDADQRRQATILFRSLEEVREQVTAGQRDAGKIVEAMKARIATAPGARLDYAAVVSFETLKPLERLQGQVLVALAVYFGSTRLIDNFLLQVDGC
jgi:pantoate--beta-alanine ligase